MYSALTQFDPQIQGIGGQRRGCAQAASAATPPLMTPHDEPPFNSAPRRSCPPESVGWARITVSGDTLLLIGEAHLSDPPRASARSCFFSFFLCLTCRKLPRPGCRRRHPSVLLGDDWPHQGQKHEAAENVQVSDPRTMQPCAAAGAAVVPPVLTSAQAAPQRGCRRQPGHKLCQVQAQGAQLVGWGLGRILTRMCSAAARGYSRGAGDDDVRAKETGFEQQHNPQHQQEQEQERQQQQQRQQEYQDDALAGSDGTVYEM